jgi:cytochrome c biogenesis protein
VSHRQGEAPFLLNIDFAGLEPQQYYTFVSILEKGAPNKEQVIAVNHPLSLAGTKIYQSSYGWAISGDLLSEKGKQQVLIRSGDLQKLRDKPLLLMKAEFFPDYLIEGHEPTTASELPLRPRAVIHVYSSTALLQSITLSPGQTMKIAGYSFRFKGFKRYTILNATSDPGLPWVWSGFTLLIGGLFIRYLIPSKGLRRQNLEH